MRSQPRSRRRASALLTVVMLTAFMAILTGSMLSYTLTERRGNERNRLVLRARNMAENISVYAAEQLTTKLYRLRSQSPMAFINGANQIHLPPPSVLDSAFTDDATGMEVHAGLTSSTGLQYLNPADSANIGNPNVGLQVSSSSVPIIAKATATHPSVGTVTSFLRHDMEVAMVPLFQFAVFYNMDMEFAPGADMIISGPVHTNGALIARMQTGRTNTLEFKDRVTAVGGFFANTAHKGSTWMNDGSEDDGPGGTGPLYFKNASGGHSDIKTSKGVWRDHKYGGSSVTTTSLNNFKTFATSTYAGNLRTSVHEVGRLVLPSISNYAETDDPSTTEDERNNGRQVIEAPKTTDTAGLKETKFSRKAGLYIIVNPDDDERTGMLPNATPVVMRPRSYRAWLNTVNADLSHTLYEVVLPGQPSYGHLNGNYNHLPNAFRTDTSVGHNQVLRLPKGGGVDLPDTGYEGAAIPVYPALTDAYFYDLRRSTGNRGHPANRSATNIYTPRAIAKIDFDLTRFKMAVERSLLDRTESNLYSPAQPNNTNWSESILNPSASATDHGLGLGDAFNVFGALDPISRLTWTQAGVYAPAQLTILGSTQGGTGAVTSYAGRFTIDETNAGAPTTTSSWTNRYTSSTNESSVTYTPSAGITGIRIRQYMAGGTATLLDEQIILPTPDLAPLRATSSHGFATGRFVIAETTNASPTTTSTWTNRYVSSADEAAVTYTPNAGVTGVRIRQYEPGGTTTLVREQVIPVIIATLSNDYHTLPTSSNTSGFLYHNAYTEMRIYSEGVDDTNNWTFSINSATASLTGGFGLTNSSLASTRSYRHGPGFNRFWVTGMSTSGTDNEGEVVIRATKTTSAGTITIDRTFTVEKQSNIAARNSPTQTGRWLTVTSGNLPDPFRIYFAPASPTDIPVAVPTASFVDPTATSSPWFDGITVYIHSVDAENRTLASGAPVRVDSGVRLWNGRGPVVSLQPSDNAAYVGRTGFSFATNDPVYVIGHFNADGDINSTLTSTANPGGYSGRYPESAAEKLTSVMGDATTILSQPKFQRNGSSSSNYTYTQFDGWCDALSGTRNASGNWSSSWRTSNPSGSNAYDGENDAITPAVLPNLVSIPGAGSAVTTKFGGTDTEVSTCFLIGIVPTNHNPTGLTGGAPSPGSNGQTSGGVHNYPRLLEIWGSSGLYIRGSMVAMFESRVAMEPWSIRVYSAPGRYWGLHQSLRDAGHDLPLEPMLLTARRMGFKEITAAEYQAQKTAIEALPH